MLLPFSFYWLQAIKCSTFKTPALWVFHGFYFHCICKYFKPIVCNWFVSMATIVYFVGKYFKHLYWLFNLSLLKWCCTSICLVREWCVGFFANASLLVAHDGCSSFLHVSHILQKWLHPNRFLCAMASGHILCLHRRKCNGR